MAWLLRQGEVLASVDVAASPRSWSGHGTDASPDCALLLSPARPVQTVLPHRPLDVAYLDADLVVLATARVQSFRVALPRRRASSVLEAEAGAFDRWLLRPGDCLEIKA